MRRSDIVRAAAIVAIAYPNKYSIESEVECTSALASRNVESRSSASGPIAAVSVTCPRWPMRVRQQPGLPEYEGLPAWTALSLLRWQKLRLPDQASWPRFR